MTAPRRVPHRSEAHAFASFAAAERYELAGAPATGALFRALGAAFPDATALYLDGARFTPAIREALTLRAELVVTVVPPGTGWPDDWYETTRLRADAGLFALLAAAADESGAAGLGTTGALFRHDDLLAEWLVPAGASAVALLEVTAALPAPRLARLCRALPATATRVGPGKPHAPARG